MNAGQHPSDEALVLSLHADAADEVDSADAAEAAAVAAHLPGCPSCAARVVTLRAVLALVNDAPVPAKDASYGHDVYRRIAPRLVRNRWWWPFRSASPALHPRPFALAFAVSIAVAGAFLLGRLTSPRAEDPSAAAVRERMLLVAIGNHLEKSELVLLEVVNGGDAELSPDGRRRARDLVGTNRLCRLAAARQGDRSAAAILDELERVLLELSHVDDPSGDTLETLRKRIEKGNVLFKVRVLDGRVRERGIRSPVSSRS